MRCVRWRRSSVCPSVRRAGIVNAASARPDGVVVPERTVVFTARLVPSLIAGLCERAWAGGQSLSAATAAAVGAYLGQGGERPGGQAR